MHDLLASAQRIVDIAALQPVPDMRFLAALRAGLMKMAASGRPITVRLLVGQYPPDDVDAAGFLQASLTADMRRRFRARGSSVNVAAMRSCTAAEECDSYLVERMPSSSWSTAARRWSGGHNMWSEDYLVDKPVHDLSIACQRTGCGQRLALRRPALAVRLRQPR